MSLPPDPVGFSGFEDTSLMSEPDMSDRPIPREEAIKLEAQNYRERFKHRMLEFQNRKDKAHEVLQQREEERLRQAQSYLLDLNDRANFRDSVRTRAQQEKDAQAELLKKQGALYRQKLRRYLRPEDLDGLEGEPNPV